jgi:hypothetical protein
MLVGMFRGWDALIEAVDDVAVAATVDAVVEARRIRDLLDAKIAAADVELVKARAFEPEGHASYASLVKARCGTTTAESRRIAVRAKKLGAWPEVLDAWQAGEVSGAKVDVLWAVVPDRQVERFAIGNAERLVWLPWVTVDDTRTKIGEWVSAADDAAQTEAVEEGDEPEAVVPEREMSASRTIDDRLEVRGSFDKDSAARIDDALRAATRPDGEGERRSPQQRRADAMVEIARFYLAHHQNPPNTGRPDRGVVVFDTAAMFRAVLRGDGVHTSAQLQIYLDAQPQMGAMERGLFLDAFDGKATLAHTLDGHSVTDLLVRHVMVDGILERLLKTGSRIIDHGRSTRIFTESQKRAMAARDGGSRISGEPPGRCDAHHSPPFDQGGTTDVNAGYLKTTREHLKQHHDGFTDRIDPDGTITLIGPTGHEHQLRPTRWTDQTPMLAVPTTAQPAPTLPFRLPAATGDESHDEAGNHLPAEIEIDWDSILPGTEARLEDGAEPIDLDTDSDEPEEIARIDAYIRRRLRHPTTREHVSTEVA